MTNSLVTFYQDSSQVTTLRAMSPVVRIEGKLATWLKPVELRRTLLGGLERARFDLGERIETLKKECQPNRQVTMTQVVLADPVSQARVEWELFRGAINEGTAKVLGKKGGVEMIAQNNGVVASRIGRRIRLALQSAGEAFNLDQTNVATMQLDHLLDKKGGSNFSGSVVLPWIHPDIWPGDTVEAIDGRMLHLGRGRVVQEVVMRFDSWWTTTLVFGGVV